MKYYFFEDYKNKGQSKTVNKTKIVKTILILVLIVALVVAFSFYVANQEFRTFIDRYVFRKEINENTGAIIEISQDSSSFIYAYDRYIIVLNKNNLTNYNTNGRKEFNIEVNISDPLFASNNRFLALAEKNGKKLYLISGENILWQKDLDGQISKVNINKNGYISIVVTGTSSKSEVKTYNLDGKDLSTVYRGKTIVIDTDISNDNKYLAIAEANYQGSLIQSSVKIISLEKASESDPDSEVYSYMPDPKCIVTAINYQDRNRLICMFDDKIIAIENNQEEELVKIEDDILFADIMLNNNFLKILKKKTGLFNSEIWAEIVNTTNKKTNLYKLPGLPKEVKTYDNIISINLGLDVYFLNTSGWLVKKYTSTKDVKDIILCSNNACIVYKDKIELLSL